MIDGFRSDPSIACMIDGNFGKVSTGGLFSKVAYQRKRCVRWKQRLIVRKKMKRGSKADCSPLNSDFNGFSDVSFRGRVHVSSNENNFRFSRCIYNRQIKLWKKIKRLNLKDENTWWEKINIRLARGGKEVEGSPWSNSNDHLTYLLHALLRIRPQQRLMLSF